MVDLGALGQARNAKRAHTQGESFRPLISQGALDRPTAHRAPVTGWTLGCAASHVFPRLASLTIRSAGFLSLIVTPPLASPSTVPLDPCSCHREALERRDFGASRIRTRKCGRLSAQRSKGRGFSQIGCCLSTAATRD